MRIIVRVSKSSTVGFMSSTEQTIRSALAHITDKIWIKSVKPLDPHGFDAVSTTMPFSMSERQDMYVIECLPQGDTLENKELADLVNETLRYNSNITLISISITPTIQVPGIEEIRDNTYKVSPIFAEYLARNDDYRKDITTKNVVEVKFEYRQIDKDTFTPTGKMGTTTKPGEAGFDPNNIYNCFAFALSNSDFLRKTLLEGNILQVLLAFDQQHELIVNVTEKHIMKFGLFNNNQDKPKIEATPEPKGP